MPEPVRVVLTAKSETVYTCTLHKSEYIQFKTKCYKSGMDIGLFSADDNVEENRPTYVLKMAHKRLAEGEIVLEKLGQLPALAVVSAPHVLSAFQWRGFWLWTANGTIALGRENEVMPILEWKDPQFSPVVMIGFRVRPHSYIDVRDHVLLDIESEQEPPGRSGEVDIVIDFKKHSHTTAIIPKPVGVRWVPCSLGEIPENAVVGGHDSGSVLYVIRSVLKKALTPGKLQQGKPYSEVCWGGTEHAMDNYEVLIDFDGDWVRTTDDNIPPLALWAGRSEDDQPLYVGRVLYRGALIVGKVQPKHKSLYIPYEGKEMPFKTFEILCYKSPGPYVTPHPPTVNPIIERQPKLNWVWSSHGRVPRHAFIAGDAQGKPVFLIRGKFQGLFYPGWMRCGDNIGHIIGYHYYCPSDDFYVLCDFHGYWEAPVDSKLPENAFVLGRNPDHHLIYIGRANHLGNLLCGMVDSSTMRCKIPYRNEGHWKNSFEVLCYPDPVESTRKRGLQFVRRWDL